jgi:hypothetical protein
MTVVDRPFYGWFPGTKRRSDDCSFGAAERYSLRGNGLSDGDAVRLVPPLLNLLQVLLKFSVEP